MFQKIKSHIKKIAILYVYQVLPIWQNINLSLCLVLKYITQKVAQLQKKSINVQCASKLIC